jgi:hypothetical protein
VPRTGRPNDPRGDDTVAGAGGTHAPGKGKTPETTGVVRRPDVEESVGKGKTTTPHTPITTVPPTREDEPPIRHVQPSTTGGGKPLKRFDDDDQPRTTRPGGVSPVQPTQPIQRVPPTQPGERVLPPGSGGFKHGAVNTPERPHSVEVPETNRPPKPDYDQIQRQQAAARQQQQANIAAQERNAAAAEARQRAAAANDARNRGDDARERAQAQAQAAQRAAAISAARERAAQAPPRPQPQPQAVPQRPPSSAPAQDPRDKDDDKKKKK